MRSKQARAFIAAFSLGGLAVAAISLRGEPRRKPDVEVSPARLGRVAPTELARWIIEGRRDFTVVDLRPARDFQQEHIRGAVNCSACHANAQDARRSQSGESFVDLSKKLVLCTATGEEPIDLPKKVADDPRLAILDGGYLAWKGTVMQRAPVGGVPAGDVDEAEAAKRRRHEAVRAFLAGERQAMDRAPIPVTPVRRESARASAGPSEGC